MFENMTTTTLVFGKKKTTFSGEATKWARVPRVKLISSHGQ